MPSSVFNLILDYCEPRHSHPLHYFMSGIAHFIHYPLQVELEKLQQALGEPWNDREEAIHIAKKHYPNQRIGENSTNVKIRLWGFPHSHECGTWVRKLCNCTFNLHK